MRTTLNIDDDLVAAATELARHERCSVGKVVSRLLRQSLTSGNVPAAAGANHPRAVAGFVPFSASPGVVVADAEINVLREAEGI